jgi:hypothetical protein
VFVRRGIVQLAGVQVWFKEGSHRDYVFVYRRPVGGKRRKEALLEVVSLKETTQIRVGDLRNPKRAAALQETLATIPLEAFGL